MKKITNDLKLIHPKATVPQRGSDCAAGYDITCVGGLDGLDPKLVAKLEEKDPDSLAGMRQLAGRALILFPGASYLFRTGITMAIELATSACCGIGRGWAASTACTGWPA